MTATERARGDAPVAVMTRRLDASCPFTGALTDVAVARGFVAQALGEPCFDGLRDDAVLAVSELVTNAIVHVGGAGSVRLITTDDALRILVSDSSATAPAQRSTPDPWAPGGRGLPIVSTLARSWGVAPVGGGKQVWCDLPLP